jgi:hypothetical protein
VIGRRELMGLSAIVGSIFAASKGSATVAMSGPNRPTWAKLSAKQKAIRLRNAERVVTSSFNFATARTEELDRTYREATANGVSSIGKMIDSGVVGNRAYLVFESNTVRSGVSWSEYSFFECFFDEKDQVVRVRPL